jgi:hypothetical protein
MEIELTFEQIKFLNDNNKKVEIESPTGFVELTDSYIKNGYGYELIWDDGTSTECHNSHRLLSINNEWLTADEIKLGDRILGKEYKTFKTLSGKLETEKNVWVDFSVNSDDEEYLQNGLVHHNSGKSLVIYTIIRFLIATGNRIMLVVPNVSLVNQMYSDFVDYGWYTVNKHVEKLYSGEKPTFGKDVLITTYQSLMKRPPAFFAPYTSIMNDEAHSVKSLELQKISKKCVNASARLGFTGTLPKNDADKYNIQGALGPVIFKYKTKALVDQGVLAQIKIANCFIKYPDHIAMLGRRRQYHDEIDLIENTYERNHAFKYVFNSIPDGQNTIIFVNHIDHLNKIAEYLEEKLDDKYTLYIIHGGIKPEARETIRKTIDKEHDSILIATYGAASTGINIKRIHNVILGSSSKSEIRVLQTIGRGLRKHAQNDDFAYKNKNGNLTKNHVYNHWEERFLYYKEQEFPCFKTTINV